MDNSKEQRNFFGKSCRVAIGQAIVVAWLVLLMPAHRVSAQASFDYVGGYHGVISVNVPSQSDRLATMIYHRAALYQGTVQSVAGNELFLNLPAGAEPLTVGKWASSSPSEPPTHAVFVESGSVEGIYFPIQANTSGSVVIDASASMDGTLPSPGDAISVVPFWTYKTLFGIPATSQQSASISGVDAPLAVMPLSRVSTSSLENSDTFFYFIGNEAHSAGWRRVGGGFAKIYDNEPIAFKETFVLRNRSSGPFVWTYSGELPMAVVAMQFVQAGDGRNYLYPIANYTSVSLSLNDLELVTTGAIDGTQSIAGIGADRILVFENSSSMFNRSVDRIFYYYSGAGFGGSGWREVGKGFANIIDNGIQLKPGEVFVISRVGRDSGINFNVRYLAPYLN